MSDCPGCGYEYPDDCDASCDYKHPMQEWISVKDRLPEQFDHVLISDGKEVTYSSFQDGSFVGRELDITVTYWMPLPKVPV